MATTGRGEESEKRSEEKRSEEKWSEEKWKREEDSVTGLKKKRRRDNSGLEEPTPGCSGHPGLSGPYARLNIRRFNIHQLLGRGAFGKVVLASVPGSNINVAVKMISKRDNEDTILREQRTLLEARHCPFLCHLYAAHQSQHRAYLITEYLSGGSLEDLIRMCGCLNIGNDEPVPTAQNFMSPDLYLMSLLLYVTSAALQHHLSIPGAPVATNAVSMICLPQMMTLCTPTDQLIRKVIVDHILGYGIESYNT
ncbi:RAC-alpha serine/threonine-protein kinase-like [Ranitomeya variabilis]|uniref:RAC-alpha serine/threonine-protein kinase-like n=1 Tax=Ranitomeya variabilis TaxID=490064 RepID=UPI004055D4DE